MHQQSSEAVPGAEKAKQVVLVVDGDCMRQFFTVIFLQRLGYHVYSVKTAEEATMIMEITLPLVILTEIALPGMSGIDLLKQIKKDPRTRQVPVLIYTALQDPIYRKSSEDAGCAGFVTQTADHNQLYEAVQKATESTPRQFVRLATSLDVVVEDDFQRKEKVTAISEHGMYVATDRPLPYGSVVPFILFLDRALAWGIRVEGKVLYSHAKSSGANLAGMGVQFEQIRPEDRELVKNFIRRKLLEGIKAEGATAP